MSELTTRQFMAWRRLILELNKYGCLPTSTKRLAEICKVGVKSFEAMLPALSRHLYRDADGRLTHDEVVAGRGDRPVMTPHPDWDADESYLTAVRKKSGRDGGLETQRRRREARLVWSREPTFASNFASTIEANGQANEADFACEGLQDPLVASPGSIDRSSSEMRVVRSSDLANVREGEPQANLGVEPSKRDEQSEANSPSKAQQDLAPGRSLDEVDDDALIAALRPLAPKVPATLLNPGDLVALRLLLAEGCELERDVIPAVRNFAFGLNEPLRTLKAKQIREKALGIRDGHMKAARERGSTQGAQVFVVEGTPPWRAWLRAKGVRSHFVHELQSDRTKRGAYFATEWPPGWDAARLAELERSTDGPAPASTQQGVGRTDDPAGKRPPL